MSSADAALEEARENLRLALAPNSTPQTRRKFREHLITLASHPSYDSKAFFGTLVAKCFGEFEDLQDATIDALLDLCEDEDEKVRIIGIKGLGPTGKADPRWVRGNTGVLLQLLACQPRELKYVRESLQTLLAVNPVDAFSVMADDCRGSEEETGASRRNVIEFLYHDVKDIRRDILESGKNTAAEDVFREGFLEVVGKVGGTESKLILEMLAPLPSVSGSRASEKTKGLFLKSLIRSVPSNSNNDTTLPLIRMLKDYLDKTSAIDPRYPLLFLAEHGKAVVQLGISKKEPSARRVLEGLKTWTNGAIDKWAGKGKEESLSEEDIAPKFGQTLLPVFLDECRILSRVNNFSFAGGIIETVLYAIYRLSTTHERRNQVVQSSDSRALRDLAREAIKEERRAGKGSTESRLWANIVDMAEVLADPRERIARIDPSWERNARRPAASSSSSSAGPSRPANNLATSDVPTPTAPRGPRGQVPPAGPRTASLATPSSSLSTIKVAPTGPRQSNGNDVSVARATPPHISAPTGPSSRSRQASPTRRAAPPAETRRRSPRARSPAPTGRPRTPPRPPTPPLPQVTAPSQPASKETTSSRPLEPTVTHSSNGNRVAGPVKAETTIVPVGTAGSSSDRSGPLKNASPTGISIRSAQKPSFTTPSVPPPGPKRTPSLADRLGVGAPTSSPSPTNKRSREDGDKPQTNGKAQKVTKESDQPSLLSRLASREDRAPQAKRVKEPPSTATPDSTSKMSLKDRLTGKGSRSASPATPAPADSVKLSSPSTASQNQNPTVPPPSAASAKGLSILSRASPRLSQTPSEPQSQSAKGLSILSRASQSASTTQASPQSVPASTSGLSIRRREPEPQTQAQAQARAVSRSPPVEEEVIVRKGRGFRAKTPDDIIMADQSAPPQGPAVVAAGGGLAGRLGPGPGPGIGGFNGIRGRGRGVGPAFGSRGLVRPNHMGRGSR